jgi:hypothetical protein
MLLSVPNLDFVAPTRKTGFCLVGLDLSFSCGGGQPGLTQIGDPAEAAAGSGPFPNTRAMGMIIGGGPDAGPNRSSSDHYGPSVEGQDVEITGVPDGRYCLSFVVDPAGNIVEGSKANNGASRLVDLGSDSYGRTVAEGAAFPDSATCGLTDPALPADPSGATTTPAPAGGTGPAGAPGGRPGTARRPPAVTDVAARLSSSALHRSFRGVAGLSRRCRPTALDSATCTVAFRQARVRYRGTVSLKQKPVAGEWRWYYRIDVRPTRGHARPVRTKTLFGGVVGVDAAAARRIARLPRGVAVPERRGAAPDDAFVCRLR